MEKVVFSLVMVSGCKVGTAGGVGDVDVLVRKIAPTRVMRKRMGFMGILNDMGWNIVSLCDGLLVEEPAALGAGLRLPGGLVLLTQQC